MEMIRVRDAAQRWNLTERSVTNFCKAGKISGARKQVRETFFGAIEFGNVMLTKTREALLEKNDSVIEARMKEMCIRDSCSYVRPTNSTN